jgi:hypothetical protein
MVSSMVMRKLWRSVRARGRSVQAGIAPLFARPLAMLLVLAVAMPLQAASERWQVVRAGTAKVGHVRILRSESAAVISDSEQLEVRLGAPGRRVTYRVRLETESLADGSLRRMLREVDASEGHSRVEAIVVGEALEVSHIMTGARCQADNMPCVFGEACARCTLCTHLRAPPIARAARRLLTFSHGREGCDIPGRGGAELHRAGLRGARR